MTRKERARLEALLHAGLVAEKFTIMRRGSPITPAELRWHADGLEEERVRTFLRRDLRLAADVIECLRTEIEILRALVRHPNTKCFR